MAFFIIFGITVFVFSLIVALVVALLVAVCFTVFCLGLALMILFPVVFFTTLTACFLFFTALGGYWAFKWMNSGNRSLPTPEGNALGDSINQITGGKLSWVMDQVREGKVEQALGPMQQEWREPSARNNSANGPTTGSGSSSGHTPKKLNKKTSNANNADSSDKKKEPPASTADNKENEPSGVSSGVDSARKAANVNNATNGIKKHANTESTTKAVNSATSTAGTGDVGKKATDATSKATGTVKGGLGSATGLT